MIAIGGGGRKGGGSLDALNEQVCIAGAIGSVAMQQYPADRLECVVAEVVLELARRWESSPGPTPRLSLVREPQRGVGPAKNRGAAAAGGEVLAACSTQFQGHLSMYHVAQIAFRPAASAPRSSSLPPSPTNTAEPASTPNLSHASW